MGENTLLLFKPPSMCYFGMGAPANLYISLHGHTHIHTSYPGYSTNSFFQACNTKETYSWTSRAHQGLCECKTLAGLIFLKDLFIYLFIYLFIDRGEGRERERETSMCGCLLCTPTGGLARNPSMFPDWELNWRPFGLQAGIQFTESYQPGPLAGFKSTSHLYFMLIEMHNRNKPLSFYKMPYGLKGTFTFTMLLKLLSTQSGGCYYPEFADE